MYQRIIFTNKEGHPMDLVVKVVKKLSKTIVVQNPEDDTLITIPRHAVESISEAQKPVNGEYLPYKVKGTN